MRDVILSDKCKENNGYCICCYECMLNEHGQYDPESYDEE